MPKCDSCNDIDTVEHFFIYVNINLFWKSIEQWFQASSGISIASTILEILLGITQESKKNYCLNYIIIKGKMYIKKCKGDNKKTYVFLAISEL